MAWYEKEIHIPELGLIIYPKVEVSFPKGFILHNQPENMANLMMSFQFQNKIIFCKYSIPLTQIS